ncbi:MAG: glycosyltransferase family 2 protein [Vicinamibacteria bacterium]|nr:glycosyltransferase family 2 protein [Vicinamibacteria bacterium]
MAASTLTAVLLMPRGFAEMAEALGHLQAQTRRDAIEVVLVYTPPHAAEIDRDAFAMFRRFVAVSVDHMPTVASGFVAAFDEATGDVIAQVEDHVMLDPEWAAAVLAAHGQPAAAVAPRLANANPATAISWANFVASFSEAIAVRPAGSVESGPGHNTSYKRAVLQQYRGDLVTFYQSERTFHYRLRKDGHVILHEPRARQTHLNISVPREALRHAFLGGALFGAYRTRRMRVVEKAARTALAPLVPPLRLWRTWRMLSGNASASMPATAWALLPFLLITHAAGEAVGYWNLVGNIEAQYERFELHRLECLRPDERALMTGQPAPTR